MTMTFQSDLKKLGLSDKESAVYLAALGLGPSAVQPIARKANVARATTYLVLDSLSRLGLVTRYEEGEKTLFVAEHPRQLERLIERREKELQDERNELKSLLPKLEAFTVQAGNKPLVRYYEGLEGLRSIRSELTRTTQKGETWYHFAPVDHMQEILGGNEQDFSYVGPRKARGIQSKAIIATKSQNLKKYILSTAEKKWAERRFVSPEEYTSASGFTICKDKIGITTFSTEKLSGTIIESESVATMMRELFTLLWNRLD